LSNGQDDDDTQGARLKVLFQPSENLRLLIAGDYTRVRGEGVGDTPDISTHPDHPWDTTEPSTDYHDADLWTLHAQLDWDVGFGNFTFIPAYSSYKLNSLTGFAGSKPPYQSQQSGQVTSELRFSSLPSSVVQWVAGAYYLHENTRGNTLSEYPFPPPPVPGGDVFDKRNPTSQALFAQATIPATERFRMSGGLRYTHDKKDFTYQTGSYACATPIPNCTQIAGTGALVTESPDWNSLTYKAGAEYDLAPKSTLYAQIATGYKAGGAGDVDAGTTPPVLPIFQPERLTAFEVGSKNRIFDDRLQINGEAYYYNYRDFQLPHFGFLPPSFTNLGAVITNVGKVHVYGGEVEANYLITPNDRVDASVANIHSRIDSYTLIPAAAFLTEVNITGFELPHTPEWSGNLAYQHTLTFSNGARLVPRIEEHTEIGSWVEVSHVRAAGTSGNVVSYNRSYQMTNLYLTYQSAADKWELGAWLRNAENRAVIGGAYLTGPTAYQLLNPPRTFGLTVTARF
jgi:iron complex outermembrane receptor protein